MAKVIRRTPDPNKPFFPPGGVLIPFRPKPTESQPQQPEEKRKSGPEFDIRRLDCEDEPPLAEEGSSSD